MINTNTSKKGFTIVETLVAIAVLMIAVAGPLVIASKGLTAAIYSKDQMVASFLAQESMEVIKNLRDAAVREGGSTAWLDNFSSSCLNGAGQICDADPLNPPNFVTTSCQRRNNGCQVYFDSDSGYTTQAGGGSSLQITPFTRYFYMEDVGSAGDQKIVHVVVNWQVGTVPFETEITGLLTSQTR